jgi:hypothetical protein
MLFRKGLTLPQESGTLSHLSFENTESCKQMANTMHLTAAYSYFYFSAFDPGGLM